MEGLNDLQLSTTTKKLGSSQGLQDRVLAQLSESLQTRARPRNPLSKFTITAPNNSPSYLSPIPAYRTFAYESLPIVSPEDQKKLNIFPVTGIPPYNSSGTDQTRSNSSKESLKTRRCLLQKKTIHRSLEDLRIASKKRNHHDPPLSQPRRKVPLCSSESMSQKQGQQQSQGDGNQKLFLASPLLPPPPPSPLCQKKEMSFQTGTDSIVNTKDVSVASFIDGGCGAGGDFITTMSNQTNEEMAAEGNIRNLSVENDLLRKRIRDEKRRCTLYRVANAFVFEAMRKRSRLLDQVEDNLLKRREECAARIILHHLLLNSWRTTKGQVTAITVENTQMHKTIDNQSLQLNVIRKMQSIDKDRNVSVLNEYNEVKKNYCQAIKENETMKEEYVKVLEEKRSLEKHLGNLSEENARLNVMLQKRLDKKEMQLRSMELDRFRADKFSRENEQLAKETELARMQIKELATQQAHWQEKAMSYESKCYELKQEMESKERAYERVLFEKRDVSKENEILTLSKSKLEKAVEETRVKLVESTAQKKQLEKSYDECKKELEDLEDQVEYLQSALRQYKKENVEIREKLYDCTLRNVKRRRVWGAALYFIVNPIEAFKRLYFGPPPEKMQPHRMGILPAVDNTEKNLNHNMAEIELTS